MFHKAIDFDAAELEAKAAMASRHHNEGDDDMLSNMMNDASKTEKEQADALNDIAADLQSMMNDVTDANPDVESLIGSGKLGAGAFCLSANTPHRCIRLTTS